MCQFVSSSIATRSALNYAFNRKGTTMKFLKSLTLACTILASLSISAFAGVTVNTPANDTDVSSPFSLSATSATCSNKSVVSMGYSFDSSSDTKVVYDQSIDTKVSASVGTHTLHVKAWAPGGYSCVKDIVVKVRAAAEGAEAIIPSQADVVSHIQALSGWRAAHDRGGPGSSTGWMSMVGSPSLYGNARKFATSYEDAGDERYSVVFSDNTDAKNIFYDTWIYLTSSSSNIANLEFDINQVMANGNTALIGFQCDGYSGTWAYNANRGTTAHPKPAWVARSGTSCNPRNWTPYKWHHVQASFYRSSTGTVTYRSVWFDGVETKLNVQAYVGADLSWDPVINTQFQVDGLGSSGNVTVYLDNLTISTW
jgi:hypothetical protein